jgi:hypothetical protein
LKIGNFATGALVSKPTTDFRIASQQQKKATELVDLLASGPGIPWEDRGSRGFLSAFFSTVFAMMFHPAKTLAKLRRPETPTDARAFSYAVGGVWFIAYCLQSTFSYYRFFNNINDPKITFDSQQYVINTALGAVLCAAAAIFGCKFMSVLFYRLTSFDATTKSPPVLSYNCITYLAGASILAIIPGGPTPWLHIAPIVVAIWIYFSMIPVAVSRLRIRTGAAIIGSTLTFLAGIVLVAGGVTLINLLWITVLGKGSLTYFSPTDVTPH